eukprot:TRINITY_DN3566_c0_g1_i1.p1 TRINITY_DN3566_c0_g1~~TRINITY_DN3566_c0_g1_i1.p1  ORF type:complete len:781 (-),score=139.88 TRINITY_DN3566_c0_g1_i1:491-2833(-)
MSSTRGLAIKPTHKFNIQVPPHRRTPQVFSSLPFRGHQLGVRVDPKILPLRNKSNNKRFTVIKEKLSSDTLCTTSNNGKESQSTAEFYTSGNGNQSSQSGQVFNIASKVDDEKVDKPDIVSLNGNGNVNGNEPVVQINVDGKSELLKAKELEIQTLSDPCAAGQVEACAATGEAKPLEVKEEGRWKQFKGYSVWRRTLEIWIFAFRFAFKYWLLGKKWTYGKEGMTEENKSKRKSELALWLREGLVKLGPTFIKIGQQFSTRVDVLSPEFTKELEKLQDQVPPFSSKAAKQIIEEDFGKPVEEIFDEFEERPIAAASLGQVHLARVNGARVVVKVQRPGLRELFDIDLKNLRVIAKWLQSVDPKSDGAARDWVAIYDECSRILYEEIDYELEAQNANSFRNNFEAKEWIKVPDVMKRYTSKRVLTMEYAPGVKVNNASAIDGLGIDRKQLARYLVESYLEQLLTYGFFHADPHPGNVAVDAENGGRLIYYDFGMMGSIPKTVKGGLLDLFYGVYQKDPDQCLDALVDMGVLVPGSDRMALRRTAQFFLNSFEERLVAQRNEKEINPESQLEFKAQRTKDESKARRKQILASIGEDLVLAAADQPFRFPAEFTFVVRSFTVLDGIGKSLDPRFDISEIAAPYARDLLLDSKPQLARLMRNFEKRIELQNRAVVNLFRGPNTIEEMGDTIQRMERGDLKLRVRALEAERQLDRVQLFQMILASGLFASTLVNIGTVLAVSAMPTAATATFIGAGAMGFSALLNFAKYANLEKKEKQIRGIAA